MITVTPTLRFSPTKQDQLPKKDFKYLVEHSGSTSLLSTHAPLTIPHKTLACPPNPSTSSTPLHPPTTQTMSTKNTLSHSSFSLPLNTHIAFLQNAIISLLAEQAKLSDKIDRPKGLVEELRWETRRDTEMLKERMGCPSCLSGRFEPVGELMRRGDGEVGVEKKEQMWGAGEVVRGELGGEVVKGELGGV